MGNQASSRRSSNASQSNPHAVAAGAPSGPSVSAVHDYLTVDGGLLYPATGIYKHVKQEWDQAVVHRLIQDRKLAPFYRGLQDEYATADGDLPAASAFSGIDDGAADTAAARLESLLDAVGVQKGEDHLGDQIQRGQRLREPEAHRKAEREAYERGTEECPICMMCACFPPDITRAQFEHQELPAQHEHLPMLRSAYLHGMPRPDQAGRPGRQPSRCSSREVQSCADIVASRKP
jgi:hypothetical protein